MDAASMTTWAQAAQIVSSGGATAVLLYGLWALQTGRLVTGREYKAKCDDCDRLRSERDAERARGDAVVTATEQALDRLAAGPGRNAPNR